jgi:predicted Zn-ribbon and HTH transcriptional regulator
MNCKQCGFETTPAQIIRVGLCRICENNKKKEGQSE